MSTEQSKEFPCSVLDLDPGDLILTEEGWCPFVGAVDGKYALVRRPDGREVFNLHTEFLQNQVTRRRDQTLNHATEMVVKLNKEIDNLKRVRSWYSEVVPWTALAKFDRVSAVVKYRDETKCSLTEAYATVSEYCQSQGF